MLENLADDATISSTNDENLLRVGVTGKGDVRNHLLIPIVA